MATLKTCFKCKAEKPRTEFYAHPRMGDGLLGKCKECTKRDVKTHRAENDSVREYDRARASLPHRRAMNVLVNRRWRAADPRRARAHGMVAKAIKIGELIPQSCWCCGAGAVAHHPNYDAPLDVIWLCQRHHKAAHAAAGV